MSPISTVATVLFASYLLAAPLGSETARATAEAVAERMLSALGGRAAWAELTNTVNDSQQNRAGELIVARAVITMDYTRPRFRIETTGPGLHLIRVIDGERSWRLTRDGRIEPVPPALVAEDLSWYAANVYRTLHRVAARDSALTLQLGTDGRLEVQEKGRRLAWFRLDARGEPYAFGAHDDEEGTLCGPWEFAAGAIRIPVWVSSHDGTFRAMVKGEATNVAIDDRLFAAPPGGGEVR